MMELSDLRIFRAVVQTGGITRAAEKLHRVQSNITTRIKKLEGDLGVALFIREGKRLLVSPAGQILFEHAQQILAAVERAHEAIHETRPHGVLRLGAMESTAAIRLPGPLCVYHDLYPEVSIELFTGTPQDQIPRIIKGDLDAAPVAEPISDPRLETLAVFDEKLVIIGNLDQLPISSPRDVLKRTVLAFHPGCPHRSRLEGWFAQDAITIERVVELTSYHAMLGCAVVGMGIAMVPLCVLETYSERSKLSVHSLHDPEFGRAKTLLIWRKGAHQAKVARLADLLLAQGGHEAALQS
jgi:DNA-binding transcriptional LysR family regulator